jgi:alkylation response protein AidB-like acyl-CoA dehydrogenase
MSLAERGMGLGLRALGRIAGSDVLDRFNGRKPAEKLLYRATRDGFRAAGAASRTFTLAKRDGGAKRLPHAASRGLFDLTPTEEQGMLQDSFRDFALERLRPAALDADANCAAPEELLTQAGELGLTMLGVPDELGGAVSERSSVTTVLAAEALAQGDMGLALALLAPAGVAAALALWGDGEQQATYLPALVGEDVPAAAAIALLEPRALFDPFALQTTARRTDGGDYVLDGVKSLVPRAEAAELLIVGARIQDPPTHGPVLLLVEPKTDGVLVKGAPAMGVRAAATGDVLFEGAKLPARALLGEGDPAVYADCVRRARLAWCALACGTGRAALDYLIPYVNERVAFGEPISHRQAVAFAISDVAIELEGMRLATLRAASQLDIGKDAAQEVALARHLCSEKGATIGSQAVQLLGGHGYIKEHPVERWYRDLRAVGLFEGALLV